MFQRKTGRQTPATTLYGCSDEIVPVCHCSSQLFWLSDKVTFANAANFTIESSQLATAAPPGQTHHYRDDGHMITAIETVMLHFGFDPETDIR